MLALGVRLGRRRAIPRALPIPRGVGYAPRVRQHSSAVHASAISKQDVLQVINNARAAIVADGGCHSSCFFPRQLCDAALAQEWPDSVTMGISVWGGYEHAARVRLLAFDRRRVDAQSLPGATRWPDIAAVRISGDFLFQRLDASAVLTAVAAAGVSEGEIGDVLCAGDAGALLLATPEAAARLIAGLHEVSGVQVAVERLAMTDAGVVAALPTVREIVSVESTCRADAVLGAGLRCGRSKAATWIKAGLVCRNGAPIRKPSVLVELGDALSCGTQGRVVLRQAQPTAKGRLRLFLDRIA